MPYDEVLAERVRALFGRRSGFAEKKMFGGVGYLLHGNMCVGVWKHWLIARIGSQDYAEALAKPGVKEFDITGRAMSGWVMVDLCGVRDDCELIAWIDKAAAFVDTLPRK